MDASVETRLKGWMPDDARLFKPKMNCTGSGITVVCLHDPGMGRIDLIAACRDLSSDVIYVRPGAFVTQNMIARLSQAKGDVVNVFTNEGGHGVSCGNTVHAILSQNLR
jgi:hypothetical protein